MENNENTTYEAEVCDEKAVESAHSGVGVGLIVGGLLGFGVLGLAIYGGVTAYKKLKANYAEKKKLAAEAQSAAAEAD